MKLQLKTLLLMVISIRGFGQDNVPNPNATYENFSMAYKNLNAEILGQTYVNDGVLLNLYDSTEPNSVVGSNEIKIYFDRFFNTIKEKGQQLQLSFKLIDRKKEGSTIYDNGYYKLIILSNGKTEYTGHGKLSTILVLDDGSWKFKVDSNCNTTQEEFENAKAGSFLQPK